MLHRAHISHSDQTDAVPGVPAADCGGISTVVKSSTILSLIPPLSLCFPRIANKILSCGVISGSENNSRISAPSMTWTSFPDPTSWISIKRGDMRRRRPPRCAYEVALVSHLRYPYLRAGIPRLLIYIPRSKARESKSEVEGRGRT